MLYVKNVPGWERAARFVMGAGLGAVAVTQYGATPIGLAIGAHGSDGRDERRARLLSGLRSRRTQASNLMAEQCRWRRTDTISSFAPKTGTLGRSTGF